MPLPDGLSLPEPGGPGLDQHLQEQLLLLPTAVPPLGPVQVVEVLHVQQPLLLWSFD